MVIDLTMHKISKVKSNCEDALKKCDSLLSDLKLMVNEAKTEEEIELLGGLVENVIQERKVAIDNLMQSESLLIMQNHKKEME